jgi:hypothetical protein
MLFFLFLIARRCCQSFEFFRAQDMIYEYLRYANISNDTSFEHFKLILPLAILCVKAYLAVSTMTRASMIRSHDEYTCLKPPVSCHIYTIASVGMLRPTLPQLFRIHVSWFYLLSKYQYITSLVILQESTPPTTSCFLARKVVDT